MTEKNEVVTEWIKHNQAGFFPGPEEDKAAFEKRVEFCLRLVDHLAKNLEDEFPFAIDDNESKDLIEKVLPRTEELYGIRPLWVPIFFSDHQLALWHGGCAWIFRLNEQSPTAAFIQLRSHFKYESRYLFLYRRDELLIHEIAHIGRMVYQEPGFEEFFAYRSSFSKWRQFFGPIVESSKESLFFILLLGLVVMIDFSLIMTDYPNSQMIGIVTGLAPIFVILSAFIRLIYRRWIYNKCFKQLTLIFSPKIALHLTYRLKDSEIRKFAFLSPERIRVYITNAKESSFRWEFLSAIYKVDR